MERQFALRHQSGIGTTHSLKRGRVDVEDHKFTGVAMNHNSVQATPLGVASHFAINYPLVANDDASSQSSTQGGTVSAAVRFGRGNFSAISESPPFFNPLERRLGTFFQGF